ncbi:ABC transporter substrate-binding protein [Reinekea forsetii]|nr:ABC transporter substrate-binding protein [Reinekea forsetii]
MRQILAVPLLISLLFAKSFAGQVEVLHYWTSGGEAAALEVLKEQMAKSSHQWLDFEVAGGGGENANQQLQARVLKGDPPTAALIKGLDIQRWARLGFLANLNDLADEQNWANILPTEVANVMKHKGNFVAVPVNVHRVNWLWANSRILNQLNITPPTNWQEFDAAAQKIASAGYQVIALGDQDWQHATLFETLALSVGGPEFYSEVFADHTFNAKNSKILAQVFDRYYQVLQYANLNAVTEWTDATESVISGEAAFQVMGDWAKGEFTNANKQPNNDYFCLPVPGTQEMFLFNIDSFAMFKLKKTKPEDQIAQTALASNIMGEPFQEAFNLNKGSIPVRTDMSLNRFDYCSKFSMNEFLSSSEKGTLLPSIAHGMATTGTIQGYFLERIGELTRNPVSPEKAAKELVKAIRYGQYIIR